MVTNVSRCSLTVLNTGIPPTLCSRYLVERWEGWLCFRARVNVPVLFGAARDSRGLANMLVQTIMFIIFSYVCVAWLK